MARAFSVFLIGLLLGSTVVSAAPPHSEQAPVVLELFTSQGCSSCPAADALLSRLGRSQTGGPEIIPLAYHIDYWNELGWHDPFSRVEWTRRQHAYARALQAHVYTPQLVLNGRSELTGSDEQRLRRELAAARRMPALAQLSMTLSHPDADERRLTVQIRAQRSSELAQRELTIMMAVVESGLTTSIEGGENSGKTLQNDFVVRRLQSLFSLSPKTSAAEERRVIMELDPAWDVAHLSLAAFLQDALTLEIYGAAAQELSTVRE